MHTCCDPKTAVQGPTKMNRNNSYERCWLFVCPTTVPPEQKHGGEGPLPLPRGGERPARPEVSLRAGVTLTDFYSSLRVPGERGWDILQSQPVRPVLSSEISKGLIVNNLFLCNLFRRQKPGTAAEAHMQEGWAALCSSSSPLWVDTLLSRNTCWRTLSFFTRRSVWAFAAHTSLTGEVSPAEVLLSGHFCGWR